MDKETTPFEHWRSSSRNEDSIYEDDEEGVQGDSSDGVKDYRNEDMSSLDDTSTLTRTRNLERPPSPSPTKTPPFLSSTILSQKRKAPSPTSLPTATPSPPPITPAPASSVAGNRNLIKLKSPPKKIQKVERIVLETQETELLLHPEGATHRPLSNANHSEMIVVAKEGGLKPLPVPATRAGGNEDEKGKGEGAIERCIPYVCSPLVSAFHKD